jgi:lipoyl-dependent peroxiredoxin subunit C
VLTVGDHFPAFDATACVSIDPGAEYATISSRAYPGKWLVAFFWPNDFTSVCPTEIVRFGELNDEFEAHDAQVIGISCDSEFVHLAWRQQHPGLRNLPFPMIADTTRDLTQACGVLSKYGTADRGTFIVDPDNVVQFAMVTADNVARNVDEVLRMLDALQTGEDIPCGWNPGDATLS